MSRVDNVVFVGNFETGVRDIEEVSKNYKQVLLEAQGEAIETAISLSEYFCTDRKNFLYDYIRSGLLQSKQHELQPKCSIKIYKIPSNQEVRQDRKDDARDNKKPKIAYREREVAETKQYDRDYNRKGR